MWSYKVKSGAISPAIIDKEYRGKVNATDDSKNSASWPGKRVREGELLAFPDHLVRASGVPVDDAVGVRAVANIEVNSPGNRRA